MLLLMLLAMDPDVLDRQVPIGRRLLNALGSLHVRCKKNTRAMQCMFAHAQD